MELIKWALTSSADPSKYSLMVKGALGIGAAYLLQLLPVLCGFHIICLAVDGNVLSTAVDTVANIRWTIAAIGHVTIAQATFEAAVTEWPHERFTLRHGIRLIASIRVGKALLARSAPSPKCDRLKPAGEGGRKCLGSA